MWKDHEIVCPISLCIILETREVFSMAVDCSPFRLPLAPIVPLRFGKESVADANILHAPCFLRSVWNLRLGIVFRRRHWPYLHDMRIFFLRINANVKLEMTICWLSYCGLEGRMQFCEFSVANCEPAWVMQFGNSLLDSKIYMTKKRVGSYLGIDCALDLKFLKRFAAGCILFTRLIVLMKMSDDTKWNPSTPGIITVWAKGFQACVAVGCSA